MPRGRCCEPIPGLAADAIVERKEMWDLILITKGMKPVGLAEWVAHREVAEQIDEKLFDAVKPGDQVTFVGHPAKNGSNSMRLAKVVLADGKELEPEAHSWF